MTFRSNLIASTSGFATALPTSLAYAAPAVFFRCRHNGRFEHFQSTHCKRRCSVDRSESGGRLKQPRSTSSILIRQMLCGAILTQHPPLRQRLGVDSKLSAQLRKRSLRSLYCSSDGVRGRGAPMTNLSHNASFHSRERIAPSNRGIKHLMCFCRAINGPLPVLAGIGNGVGYSAKHLVA